MIFAPAMAIACLTVMKAMCWLTGSLLLLLTAVQSVRGDAEAQPLATLAGVLAFAGLGAGSSWLAEKFRAAEP